MSSFNDKNILITGGAGGIGLRMGRLALEKQAANLVVWDVEPKNIEKAKQHLEPEGDRLHTFHVDVSDSEQVYRAAEQVIEQLDHIDILINNAGIVVGGPFDSQQKEDIERTIAVNLLGVMHTTRAFLPGMKKRASGHIVNIASAAGHMGNPNMAVYAGSKWGVIGWSESLRIELRKEGAPIRLTCVEPGYIDTGMFEGVTPPKLTPLLDPEKFSRNVIKAVTQNRIHLRTPFMVKLLPFLKGVLPTRIFDFVAGKLFQVYHSMDTFTGHRPKEN